MPRSRIVRAAIEYLSEKYPGLISDCVSYQVERLASGEEYITLRLVVDDKMPGTPS